ncbi:MAG: proline--tRNA ligase [Bacilli bacterium]
MKENKVKDITSRDIDFSKWYTDVVKKADLIDYSSVKGCMIIRPYGYAIWENIQSTLDKTFKKLGHQNVYMPMFIPESLLNKEKEHVQGFAPEVAWVTHGGSEKLEEKLCVRPTSETLFCEHYAKIINSYRDLPKLYNQWCSVVRWEKTTRPFLRSREFLWQEGHTIHATEDEARLETITMLNCYADFCKNILAIPVIKGRKTEKEKFAGAVDTYTIEALMYNGIALQSGTSHYFGDGFAKAFNIVYSDKENKLKYAHQTSWGVTTRLIGAIIMVHSDDNGLVLPPNIAPNKVIIIPIGKDDNLNKRAYEFKKLLECNGINTIIDNSDKSPGFKFAEAEVKGIPVRIEFGQRDLENDSVTMVRRDNGLKEIVKIEDIPNKVLELLAFIQNDMYERALLRKNEMTFTAKNLDEMEKIINKQPGFIKAMWCGNEKCEIQIKEKIGVTSRCIPLDNNEKISDKCVCCGKDAKELVYWGKQY